MNLTNKELGVLGEDFAEYWFKNNGYEILDRNWRGNRVELDLVVRKDSLVIFVEVKTRRSINYGYPAEAVTNSKLQNIKSAALQWLAINRTNSNRINVNGIRIDVLALNFDGKSFQVLHLPGVSQ